MPMGRLVLYPGLRHCFFMEDYERFNSEVIDFLESTKPAV